MSNESQAASPTIVIEPAKGWSLVDAKAFWAHRDLFWILAWRDLTIRYKQTILGAAWAILQPIITMVVFSVVFGRFIGLQSNTVGPGGEAIPYPVFTFSAILPWSFFAATLTRISSSLISNTSLLTKVYFPRLLLPASSIVSGVVDLAVAFVVLLVMMVFYGIIPTATVLALPLFVLLAAMGALAVGLWLAALNVAYRDVGFITGYLVNAWMYLTPVIYPISSVPEKWRLLYGLNPMVAVVQGFRWALLGDAFPGREILLALVVIVPVLITGLLYFRRVETEFADVV